MQFNVFERVTKPFKQVDTFTKQATQAGRTSGRFYRTGGQPIRTSGCFHRMGDQAIGTYSNFFEQVTQAIQTYANFFKTANTRLVHGIPFGNGKLLHKSVHFRMRGHICQIMFSKMKPLLLGFLRSTCRYVFEPLKIMVKL